VSAYSLFELPGMKSRIGTILKLWTKTENYLVIVEEGTNAGFKVCPVISLSILIKFSFLFFFFLKASK